MLQAFVFGQIGAHGAHAPSHVTRVYKTGFVCYSLVQKIRELPQSRQKETRQPESRLQNAAAYCGSVLDIRRKQGFATGILVLKASDKYQLCNVYNQYSHLPNLGTLE